MPEWDQRFPRAGFLSDTSDAPDAAYERHKARIESKALRDSYQGTAVVEDVRGAVCEKHGFVPAQPRPHITVNTMAAAVLCPSCRRDQLEADSPPPKEKLRLSWSGAHRQPSQREVFAWQDYLTDNAERLIREGKPHLVDEELEEDAVARMDLTHFAAKREDQLTDEEKRAKRRASHRRYWAKHIYEELPRSARRSSDVQIEMGSDYDGPVTLRQGIAYVKSDLTEEEWEDSWPRDDRSFVGRWLDERRRWSLPRRVTPLPEDKADSLVEKITGAIRSVVSQEGNDAESVPGND
jgi:hypothetical protein